MEDTYAKAVEGFEVGEATARRIRGLIKDAWDLMIVLPGTGVFVEALPQPPHGVSKVLGRFNSMSEAQTFAWAWLTGPYGAVKDIRFVKARPPNLCEVDLDVLILDIRSYLEARTTRHMGRS